jgi:hypothetical protein
MRNVFTSFSYSSGKEVWALGEEMSGGKAVYHYQCRKEKLFEANRRRSCDITKKRRRKAVWR